MKRLYVFPLLLIAMLLCSIATSAHDFEVDGIYYKITDLYKTNVAVSFKGDYFDSYPNEYSGSVTIPETVTYAGNTYSVTSIGEGAFRGCSDLTSVSLASTINSIDDYAFSDCFSLSEINITDSVTYIGGFAFSDCISLSEINIPNSITSIFSGTFLRSGLTSITIPNSVTNIGGGAFQYTGLTEINIPNSVTSIGGGAFLGCFGLTDITIPNSVTSIEQGAFQYTGWYNNQLDGVLYLDNCCLGLKSGGGLGDPIITIKDGTRLIAEHAFDGCIFTSITIPSSVTNIGKNVFYNCNLLKSIVVESGNSVYDSRDNCNAIIETATNTLIAGCKRTIIPNSVTSIGGQAFNGCSGLTSITIPNSVTSIENRAFDGCSGLTEITIPNSVTSIGSSAFARTGWYNSQPDGVLYLDNCCLGYKGELIGDLTLAEGTRLIAKSAFSGCSGLTEITIPNSVTSIGSPAFIGCDSLAYVSIGNSVTSFGNQFSNCNIKELRFEDSSTVLEISANEIGYSNVIIETLYLGRNIIGSFGYKNEKTLKNVTIGDSVTSIGDNVFDNYVGLTYVSIGSSVTSIGGQAFSGCDSLAYVSIGRSVKSIGYMAFSNCKNLKELRFENSSTVLDISKSLLNNNNVIETLYLGRNIIGSFDNIENVTIGNSVTNINNIFDRCSGLTSIVVKSGNIVYDSRDNCNAIIETATNTLIAGCKRTIIPNSVTSIGDQAFSGCSGLTEITIPNSVTSIGRSAFYKCAGLNSVSIGNSVTSIGLSAFYCCDNIKELRFEDSSIELDISNSDLNYNNIIETLYLGRNIIGSFRYSKTLKNVTIGDFVTNINNIFDRCSGLTSIVVKSGNIVYDSRDNCNAIIETATNTLIAGCKRTIIPNSVTSIGSSAFLDCSGLTEITIPNSVTSIGSTAFLDCSGLTEITIPNSVTSIGYQAFRGCSGLSSIVVESGNIVYDSRDNCNAIIKTKTNELITGCETTIIPNSVKSIGREAFSGCSGLTEIIIPESVIGIGNDAFYGTGWYNNQPDGVLYLDNCCLGPKGSLIGDLTLAEGTRLISDYAFSWCGGLTSVTIPNSVKILGSYVFQDCTKLESVTIGNSINHIFYGTFYYCTNLKSIILGSSVKEIDNDVFSDCNGLELIKVLNPIPPKCNDNVFAHYNSLLEVPEGSLDAYRQARVWCNFNNITEVSGIEDVKVDATDIQELGRYDIDGQLLTEPTPGINIIKMSDGSTRKEWVK